MVLLPALGKAREEAGREQCRANLQRIAFAVNSYAAATPGGRYPDSLDVLIRSGAIPADAPACPAGPASAPSAYRYVARGLSAPAAAPSTVLLYEPAGRHGDAAPVLFADGTVLFLDRRQAAQVFAELDAGQNPPPAARALRE